MSEDEGLVAVEFLCTPEGRDLDVALRGLVEPGLSVAHCFSVRQGFVLLSRLARSSVASCPVCGNAVDVRPIRFEQPEVRSEDPDRA